MGNYLYFFSMYKFLFVAILVTFISAGCAPSHEQNGASSYKYIDPSSGEEAPMRTDSYRSNEQFKLIQVEFLDPKIQLDLKSRSVHFSLQLKRGLEIENVMLTGTLDSDNSSQLFDRRPNAPANGPRAYMKCEPTTDAKSKLCNQLFVDFYFLHKQGSEKKRLYKKQFVIIPNSKKSENSNSETILSGNAIQESTSMTQGPQTINTLNAVVKKNKGASTQRIENSDTSSSDKIRSQPITPTEETDEGSFIAKPLPADFFRGLETDTAIEAENEKTTIEEKPEGSSFTANNPNEQKSATNKATKSSENPETKNKIQKPSPTNQQSRYPSIIPIEPPQPVDIASETYKPRLMNPFTLDGLSFDFELLNGGIAVGAPNGGGRNSRKAIPIGKIKFDGTLLPDKGTGFVRYSKSRKAYGTGYLVKFIQDFAQHFSHQNPMCGELEIGNLSLKQGGILPFDSCERTGCSHLSHQNGLEVDLSYLPTPACNFELFKLLAAVKLPNNTPAIDGALVHPRKLNQIFQWLKTTRKKEGRDLSVGDFEGLRIMHEDRNHDDHIHLRLRCSPLHEGCWQEIKPWRQISKFGKQQQI